MLRRLHNFGIVGGRAQFANGASLFRLFCAEQREIAIVDRKPSSGSEGAGQGSDHEIFPVETLSPNGRPYLQWSPPGLGELLENYWSGE